MNIDSLDKMSSLHIKLAVAFLGILFFVLPTSFFSLNYFTSTIMVLGSVQSTEKPQENIVQIFKNSMTSYSIVNNETEFIGAFDTTYSISGNSDSLMSSQDAIISVIQEDFSRSPTIGYIKVGNASTSSTTDSEATNSLTLPNPFADLASINQTIRQKIVNAIDSVDGLDVPIVDIKCDFDMNIADWKCVDQGLDS
jgi:hypothetical protein